MISEGWHIAAPFSHSSIFKWSHIICWSPNWNEPQTDSGTPRFGILTNPYPNRFGDPRTKMGPPIWMPFQWGDSNLKPKLERTPNRFWLVTEQSPFGSGIPVLVWGCIDPHFGLGIPESFRVFLWRASPFWFGDLFLIDAVMLLLFARPSCPQHPSLALGLPQFLVRKGRSCAWLKKTPKKQSPFRNGDSPNRFG